MPQSWTTATIFTIGHSTRPITEFIALLEQVDVGLLVDVRSVPRSRTNPQFNTDALPISLAAVDITYCHLRALGGLRHRRKDAPPSPNTLWRNLSFRNYADYAATDAFRLGLDQLRALAREHHCAIMCAEAVWWRCHRRIITDYLLAEGIPVAHIMGYGKVALAKPTPGVRSRPDGTLVYPAAGDKDEDARQRVWPVGQSQRGRARTSPASDRFPANGSAGSAFLKRLQGRALPGVAASPRPTDQ